MSAARVRRLHAKVAAQEGGVRLDAFLQTWLPRVLGGDVSRSALRRLIMAGAVRVAGRPLRRPGAPLAAGTRVEAELRLDRLTGPVRGDRLFALEAADVVYEDDSLIVVSKPPGLPTHATADPRRPNLVSAVHAYLGSPYLAVHQRLDRDTSGLVLFAKDPQANAGLAAAFAARAVGKTYLALTRRPPRLPPAVWESVSRLDVADRGRAAPVRSGADSGVEARTRFRRLETHAHGLLLEAQPLTGRKHQIRAQLAEAGLPILGDTLYGPPGPPAAPRLMLHAWRLELTHPLTGVPLRLECPPPPDFQRALAGL